MSLSGTMDDQPYWPIVGVLLFLLVVAAALATVMLVAAHASAGTLPPLDDLLPTDVRMWSNFTA